MQTVVFGRLQCIMIIIRKTQISWFVSRNLLNDRNCLYPHNNIVIGDLLIENDVSACYRIGKFCHPDTLERMDYNYYKNV
jgi:hypothetical protein